MGVEREKILEEERMLEKVAADYIKVHGFDEKGLPLTDIEIEDYWMCQENFYNPNTK